MTINTICCVCHKTKSLHGWLDQFLEQYKQLSHGYCPECFQKTMDKIKSKQVSERHTGTLIPDLANQRNDDFLKNID